MTRGWLALGSLGLAAALFGACGGSSEDGGSSPATGGSAGSAGASGVSGGSAGTAGTGAASAAGGTGGSSGAAGSGPTGLQLGDPCDPTADPDPCAEGVCAGTPAAGFYCRQECAPDASFGDPCNGGICLSIGGFGPGSDVLVCTRLDDCDFVTSDGCDTAAGEGCVVVDFEPLATACLPAGDIAAGESCDASGASACAPGLACLGSDLDDNQPGVCTPLCVPGEPLPADCTECIALTAELGSCAECSVLAQDCPAGSACYPVSEALGGVCVEFGPGDVGDLCTFDSAESCQDGLLCMEEDIPDAPDILRCVEICDLAQPDCADPTFVCNDIGVLDAAYEAGQLALCMDFGLQFCWPDRGIDCSGGAECMGATADHAGMCLAECDPSQGEAACDGNFACAPWLDGTLFFEAFLRGNGVCGAGCNGDGQCGADGTCLHVDGLSQPGVCGSTCDPTDSTACPPNLSCVPTPEDPAVGACIITLGAAPCDPSTADDPCLPPTACVALAGSSTEGACMVACQAQNPQPCGDLQLACVTKTADQWHSGVCIGSPESCDPVAQSGCDAGETCEVLGGGAFGGQALMCETAGTVETGGDCAGDDADCVEGLFCVADVCREPCDPADDQCSSGSCEDVSSGYYLSAGSVGACTVQ